MDSHILVIVSFALLVFFAAVAVFQWLWNVTMPEQFGLKELRYWAAFRVLLIAGFLTSGGFVSLNL